jgi:hypothetical protein
MRLVNILFATLAVALKTLPGAAQEPSPLRFEATEWNFGSVPEAGGEVSHSFRFTNTADIPVAIDRVLASCGCTTPEYPRSPIPPGGKATIKVSFEPLGQRAGDFSKSISVVSGGGRWRDFLTIGGYIVPRPKPVEEEFPHDAGGGLRLSTTLLAFRTVRQGSAPMMTVEYINTSPKDITLTLETVEQSGVLSVFTPERVCAGCRGVMTFTYDISDRIVYGQVYDVVLPVVDGVPAKVTIYSTMTGVGPTREMIKNYK